MPDGMFRNVSVRDGRVVVVSQLRLFAAAASTLLYCLILYGLGEDGFPVRRSLTAYWVTFLVATPVWLWYLAQQKATTVFNAAERLVRRRNLLWPMKALPFDDVDGITEVGHEEGGATGSYFRIALKGNRYGKGHLLTKAYSGADPELLYLRAVAIPAIQRMIHPEGEPTAEPDRGVDPGNPRFYSKIGGKYVRRFGRAIVFLLAAGGCIAALGLRDGNGWTVGLGASLAALSLMCTAKIGLDTDTRLVRVYMAFGLWEQRTAPFSDYVAVEATRNSGGGIYRSTRLEMRFEGKHRNVPLAMVYFTGSLAPLADETDAIVRGCERVSGE